jgi:SAM-dependent methyltransferase
LVQTKFKILINVTLKKRGKTGFIQSLPAHARVLDVGCGNNSPMKTKTQRPDLDYTGMDVGDYNQTAPKQFADKYLIRDPEHFSEAIEELEGQMDAVISSHNIEHCNQPERVIRAMLRVIRPGGAMYMAFPAEASLRFPSRRGTLNFHDDPTHLAVPNWDAMIGKIQEAGFEVEYSARRYRPPFLFAMGLILEPLSALLRKSFSPTWALYGFESVLWVRRPKGP